MNYTEAIEKKKSNEHLTGKTKNSEKFPFEVETLLILPKKATLEKYLDIIRKSVQFGIEFSLKSENVIDEDLDVFVFAKPNNYLSVDLYLS